MKQIVVLCDGMSDYPLPGLGGKTPMELATKPNIDYLARHGIVGLAAAQKDEDSESDLSIFGYDPVDHLVSRSYLEAVGNDVSVSCADVILCCNFITLSDADCFEKKILLDSRAGEISTDDAKELIHSLNKELSGSSFCFYPGDRFRAILVWKNGAVELGNLKPPHTFIGKEMGAALEETAPLAQLLRQAADVLSSHSINKKREEHGLPPANGIWLWSAGQVSSLPSFEEQFDKKASVLSATGYIKGIALLAGMKLLEIDEASDEELFDYSDIAETVLKELEKDSDIIFVHLEMADTFGHQGNVQGKIDCISQIDKDIIEPVKKWMEENQQDYKMLLLPNHATPLHLQTHTDDPVPFFIYSSAREYPATVYRFTEKTAKETEIFVPEGYTLLKKFLDY